MLRGWRDKSPFRPVLSLVPAQSGPYWMLQDAEGTAVGRLAGGFVAPEGMRCVAARVFAVVTRRHSDLDPEWAGRINAESWEVVLPELVFEAAPARQAAAPMVSARR